MNEKEKAYIAFEKLIETAKRKASGALEKKVIKRMNAVDDNGNAYATESDIMDAYGYDLISDAERRRLLTALEYRENRPRIKEDYFISLCERALAIVYSERANDMKEEKRLERWNKISKIEKRGNQPRYCVCCGEIVGEVLGGNIIGTDWYDNHRECAEGHVCKDCLDLCRGHSNCRRKTEEE